MIHWKYCILGILLILFIRLLERAFQVFPSLVLSTRLMASFWKFNEQILSVDVSCQHIILGNCQLLQIYLSVFLEIVGQHPCR